MQREGVPVESSGNRLAAAAGSMVVYKREKSVVDGTGGINEEVSRKEQKQWLKNYRLLHESLAVNKRRYAIFSNISFSIDLS